MKSAVALFVLLLLTHCHSKKPRRCWKANQKKPNQKKPTFVKTSRINTFDTGWRRIEESLPKDGSGSEDDDITGLFDNKGTNNDKDDGDLKTGRGQTPPDLQEKEDQTWEPRILTQTRFRPLGIGWMKIEEILPMDESGSEDDDITDLFDNEGTNNEKDESDMKTARDQTPPDLQGKEDQKEPQIYAMTRFRPSKIGWMKIEEILPMDESGSEDDDITDLFDNEATNNDKDESDLERLLEDSLLQAIEENKPSEN